MGQGKEFYISGLSPEELERIEGIANEDLGESEELDPKSYDIKPEDVPVRIWQPDKRCLTVYRGGKYVHADEIDIDSRLGQLLEELSKIHPSPDQ